MGVNDGCAETFFWTISIISRLIFELGLGWLFPFISASAHFVSFSSKQAWNVLALDGSNWQRIDLFDFQRDIEV